MSPTVTEQAIITPPPHLWKRDWELLGYYFDGSSWEKMECSNSGEAYLTSDSYAGCQHPSAVSSSGLTTGCTNQVGSAQETLEKFTTCHVTDFTCVTQTIYEKTSNLNTAKTNIFCGNNYKAVTIYRELPTTPLSSTVDLSSSSSTPSSPTPTSTSHTATQSATPPPQPQSTSRGVIAGATVAGLALLLVVAFLAWFFGVHRRKERRQDRHSYPIAMEPNQFGSSGKPVDTRSGAWEAYAPGLNPDGLHPLGGSPGLGTSYTELAAESRDGRR